MYTQRTYRERLRQQTMAVLKKNFYNMWINKFGLIFMIALPSKNFHSLITRIVLCSIFVIFMNTVTSSGQFTDEDVIEKIERCKNYDM